MDMSQVHNLLSPGRNSRDFFLSCQKTKVHLMDFFGIGYEDKLSKYIKKKKSYRMAIMKMGLRWRKRRAGAQLLS